MSADGFIKRTKSNFRDRGIDRRSQLAVGERTRNRDRLMKVTLTMAQVHGALAKAEMDKKRQRAAEEASAATENLKRPSVGSGPKKQPSYGPSSFSPDVGIATRRDAVF